MVAAHSATVTPEKSAWYAINHRCTNPSNASFATHGAIGIEVCPQWRLPHGFAQFLADVGPRPAKSYRLKRIDLSKNFTPENCRWVANSGMWGTPTYSSWANMNDRCLREKNLHYKNYGGRGIKICDRWKGWGGFANFLADMGEAPPGHSIDRIDVNGDYELGNCRWATALQQGRNTRRTKFEPHEPAQIRWLHSIGYSQTEIAKFYEVNQTTISMIIKNKLWAESST